MVARKEEDEVREAVRDEVLDIVGELDLILRIMRRLVRVFSGAVSSSDFYFRTIMLAHI